MQLATTCMKGNGAGVSDCGKLAGAHKARNTTTSQPRKSKVRRRPRAGGHSASTATALLAHL